MPAREREEVFDPFGELTVNGLSRTQVIEMWRAECWQWYLNGGGGDPFYFDYDTAIRTMRER